MNMKSVIIRNLALVTLLTISAQAQQGLLMRYYAGQHSTSLVDPLSNLLALTPTSTTTFNGAISFSDPSVSLGAQPENYTILWTGWFVAPTAGTYTFRTGSDDGSLVYLDLNGDGVFETGTSPSERIVNNNYYQGVNYRDGTVTLAAQAYRIAIPFYQGGGGEGMYAQYMLPGDEAYRTVDTADGRFFINLYPFDVAVADVTAVGETTATLNGVMSIYDAAAEFNVWALWSTNDWDEVLGDWQAYGGTASLGQPEEGVFDYEASGLAADTTYYYRFFATNDTDTAWSDQAASFKTLGGAPVVDNAGGATLVGGVRATLHGNLTGGSRAHCRIYLGEEDGVWTQTLDFGERDEGSFSTNVTALALDTTYFYRAYASNAVDAVWAPDSASFTTATSSAETLIWNGTSGGNWNEAANWHPAFGIYPQALDTVVFSNLVTGGTVNLNGDQAVYRILYGSPTMDAVPSFTISGNTLTLGTGGIHFYSKGGNSTINSAITLSAPSTIASYSGWPNEKLFTLGGAIDTAGHRLTLHNPGNRINVNQAIFGSGPLRVSGSGAVYLNADNSLTGPLTVAGRAIMENSTARFTAVSSVAVVSGGDFQIGGANQSLADDGVTTFGRIPNAVPFALYGSSPQAYLVGQNNVATTERVGELTLGHGVTRLLVVSGTDSTATLIPQSVERVALGRPVCFVYTGTRYNLGSGGHVRFADGGTSLTQIGGDGLRATNRKIVPWMFTRTAATENGGRTGGFSDMVAYDAVNGLTQMNAATDYVNATEIAFPVVHEDGNDNVRLPFTAVQPDNADSTVTLSGDTVINSLLFYNDKTSADDKRLTLDGDYALTVKSGLIMAGVSAAARRLQPVALSVTTINFADAEGILIMAQPQYGHMEVNSALLGSSGLTVHVDAWGEQGHVRLGGDNAGLTGPYTLIGGPVRPTHANAFGDGAQDLILSSGTLHPWVSGNLTVASLSGIGLIERIWNASGKRLNIGDAAAVTDETIQLRAGGAIRPGFADKAGMIELRNMSHVKLLGGTLALDLLIDGDSDHLYVSDPGDRNPAVQINGTSLQVKVHAVPETGALFRIVRVQGPNPVTGQFGEGELVEAQFQDVTYPFRVHYNADTADGVLVAGNSVVLEALNPAPRGTLILFR